MSFVGRCTECGKGFRVPHDRKEWSCKSCGGVLALEAEEPAEEVAEDGADCPACGAVNPADAAFCEECGANMETGEAPARERPKRGKRGRSGPRPKSERQQVNAEFKRVTKGLNVLRRWLIFSMILQVLQVLAVGLAIVALIALRDELDDEFAGAGMALFAVGAVLVLGQFIATVVAIKRIFINPLPVTLWVAGLATLNLAISAIEPESWWALLIPGLIVLLFWKLVFDAAALSKLMQDHPDHYFSRRARGETGASRRRRR